MLNATISGKRFKEFFKALSAFISEATLNINETGISSSAIDQSGVALVEIILVSDAFESYKATDGKVGISLVSIVEILELIDDEEKVSINLNITNQTFDISISGMLYEISLIDISTIKTPVKVSESETPSVVVLRGIHLKRGIKASEKVSDYVYINVNTKGLKIKAMGILSKIKLSLKREDLIKYNVIEDTSLLLASQYLVAITKVIKNNMNVKLEIANQLPIKISFDIADRLGAVTYYLAPRVENE